MKPTVGRIVEYTIRDKNGNLQIRPAIIVQVWNDEMVNLQVFTDGSNDGIQYSQGHNLLWATSVHRSDEKRYHTWNWMEYQKGQAAKTEELESSLASINPKHYNPSKLVALKNGQIVTMDRAELNYYLAKGTITNEEADRVNIDTSLASLASDQHHINPLDRIGD